MSPIPADSPYRVKPDQKIDLDEWSTDDTGDFKDKDSAKQATDRDLKKLDDLQYLLYANASHALLIVLQAIDAGGKDGAIRHVFSGCNPQGCTVASFKVPSPLEASHDYLWRYHQAVPPRGMIGIFNRSHYESVLVERVNDLTPKKVWEKRYDQINAFEAMLASERIIALKFFLHISKGEQKRRLEARIEDPAKNWKFDAADLKERRNWKAYCQAFQDALSKCSTRHAPWYVVPSDHKWYRNWVLGDVIVRTLQNLRMKTPQPKEDLSDVKVR